MPVRVYGLYRKNPDLAENKFVAGALEAVAVALGGTSSQVRSVDLDVTAASDAVVARSEIPAWLAASPRTASA